MTPFFTLYKNKVCLRFLCASALCSIKYAMVMMETNREGIAGPTCGTRKMVMLEIVLLILMQSSSYKWQYARQTLFELKRSSLHTTVYVSHLERKKRSGCHRLWQECYIALYRNHHRCRSAYDSITNHFASIHISANIHTNQHEYFGYVYLLRSFCWRAAIHIDEAA